MAATEMSKYHVLACRSDTAGPMWTKIGTVKRLDPRNKPVKAFFKNCKIHLAWRGQMSKFDLILPRNHGLAYRSKSVYRINTKSHMDMHCIIEFTQEVLPVNIPYKPS